MHQRHIEVPGLVVGGIAGVWDRGPQPRTPGRGSVAYKDSHTFSQVSFLLPRDALNFSNQPPDPRESILARHLAKIK